MFFGAFFFLVQVQCVTIGSTQSSCLHTLLQAGSAPQPFLVFHDAGILKDYRLVILQNVLVFGFVRYLYSQIQVTEVWLERRARAILCSQGVNAEACHPFLVTFILNVLIIWGRYSPVSPLCYTFWRNTLRACKNHAPHQRNSININTLICTQENCQ